MFDLQGATLTVLAVIGTVNIITIWKPETDSKTKFIASLIVAFIVGFVPADFGNIIANHIKDAITVAVAGSGAYKLFSKAGGE